MKIGIQTYKPTAQYCRRTQQKIGIQTYSRIPQKKTAGTVRQFISLSIRQSTVYQFISSSVYQFMFHLTSVLSPLLGARLKTARGPAAKVKQTQFSLHSSSTVYQFISLSVCQSIIVCTFVNTVYISSFIMAIVFKYCTYICLLFVSSLCKFVCYPGNVYGSTFI